jgi:hypothetical protein
MPYKVYKKGSGYKTCKKGGNKCFSNKPMSKEKAQTQMKAMYANESLLTEEEYADTLEYFKLWKYPKANQYQTWFKLASGKNVLVVLVFSTGETMDDIDYIETRVTDGDFPNIQIFEDPQSEEAKRILSHYGLTGDDIENAGEESYERINRYVPQSEEGKIKESLEYEKLFGLIMVSESKTNT